MRPFNFKLAAVLLLALGLGACNPFEVAMPEPGSTSRQSQKAASSIDLPTTEAGSAQVSLLDSTSEDNGCRPMGQHAHGRHGR